MNLRDVLSSMRQGQPDNQRPIMAMDSRTLASHNQITDLLTVFGTLAQFLTRPPSEEDYLGEAKRERLAGEVKIAVETSIIKTCSRLDAIVDDKARWELKIRDSLEKALIDSNKASTEMFKAQAAAQKDAQKPHARYNPAVLRLKPGIWIAIKGSLADLDHSIVGIGQCPQGALDSFDEVFNGTLTPEQIKWLKDNETTTLDQIGNREIEEHAGEQPDGPGDSEFIGPDTESGGADSEPPANPGPDGSAPPGIGPGC